MPLFVISFEYLAKPLMIFWHTRHICRNLPFLNIPLFVTSNKVLPDRWWILAQFPIFSNLPFLCKSPTVNMPVLLFHCLSLCQICWFHKICHFRKTHNRHASFVISSFEFWQTSNELLPNSPPSHNVIFLKIANCQHPTFCHLIWIFGQTLDDFFGTLAISVEIYLFSIFPSLSPQMRFCQTVDGFLPNSPFSQICHFCVNRHLSICLFCCFIVSVLAKFAGFAKYVIFVNPQLSTCLFCDLVLIFAKP